MTKTERRTLVGVPYYDGEGLDVLTACLADLDRCLNNLKIDAKIVVGINGPRVSRGEMPLSRVVNLSCYNAEVEFIKTSNGMVNTIKEICIKAETEGYRRIFLSDADISRLPKALYHMWHLGDQPIVGTNYSVYPLELLYEAGIHIAPHELTLMRVFEADKHPLMREFVQEFRPVKRLKGSLLLVDTGITQTMFGNQSVTTDSRMNSMVPESHRQLINNTGFMHYGRICLKDHIMARLRHFRAAAIEGELDLFAEKSLLYTPDVAEGIATRFTDRYHKPDIASDFLLQCALRYHVSEVCCALISRKSINLKFDLAHAGTEDVPVVHSFTEAYRVVARMFNGIDWEQFDSPVTNGDGVTQENLPRAPINLEPFLSSTHYRHIIMDYLGIADGI